jgi:hypothetical protein
MPLDKSNQTHGGSMTCWVMCGSRRRTGLGRTTTPAAKRVIPQDHQVARIERWAAVLGTTMPGTLACRTVTGSHRIAATSTPAFGASGNDLILGPCD